METQKKCTRCKKIKPLGEFYWRKSTKQYRSWCKQCLSVTSKKRYYANHQWEVERKRAYSIANRNVILAKCKRYNHKYREERNRQTQAYRQKHPLRHRAHEIVAYARKIGKLIVGDCVDCGVSCQEKRIQGHHQDYNKPLEVIWLCQSCHQRRHSSVTFA